MMFNRGKDGGCAEGGITDVVNPWKGWKLRKVG
jgi:hypothetical protein